jgi:hypothetical protein
MAACECMQLAERGSARGSVWRTSGGSQRALRPAHERAHFVVRPAATNPAAADGIHYATAVFVNAGAAVPDSNDEMAV